VIVEFDGRLRPSKGLSHLKVSTGFDVIDSQGNAVSDRFVLNKQARQRCPSPHHIKKSHKTMLHPGRAQALGLNQDFLYDGGAKSIFS
jgi:hypothetical protein